MSIAVLEIDIKGQKVQERQVQVLSRGVVHICDQTARRLLLGGAVQPPQEGLDSTPAMPADDGRGNLVADRVTQYGRVAGASVYARANTTLDITGQFTVVEEGNVLLPGQTDHDAQPVLVGQIENPAGRNSVGPHGVRAAGCDVGEVDRKS